MRGKIIVFLHLFVITHIVAASGHPDNECKPVITTDKDKNIIFVRPHENAFLACTLTQARFNDLISRFLQELDNQQAQFNSIYMGRLVEHPWLSKYLAAHARTHTNWNAEKGQPRTGFINELVREILSAPDITSQIQQAFQAGGYIVTGVSVEKVLVSRADEIKWLGINEPVLVPYDALTHIRLKKSGTE